MITNIYALVDAELTRLHQVANRMDIPPSQFSLSSNGSSYGGFLSPNAQNAQNMIAQLNEAMLCILRQHDVKIQEKIAELALADVQNGKT